MPLQTQELTVSDFSGGLTDNHIGADKSKYETADNFILFLHGNEAKLNSRDGSVLYDETHFNTITAGQRIGTLFSHDNDELLLAQTARQVFIDDGGWAALVGPDGFPVFTAGDTTSSVSHSSWNRHTYLTNDGGSSAQKIYRDDGGTYQVRNMGLPALATPPSLAANAGAGTFSYIYAFFHKVTYRVNTVEFEVDGPVTQVAVVHGVAITGGTPTSISAIPILTNGATENYDVTGLDIEIYRTTAGGTTFYRVGLGAAGKVDNGVTTFSDTTTDTILQDNQVLYTDGGVPDFDPPPRSKYLHVAGNNICWFGNITDESVVPSENRTNRVLQSIPNQPDSVPASFFVDMEYPVVGISSVGDIPVVFTTGGVYRLDGYFDLTGRGSIQASRISDRLECLNHQSIVQTRIGVFFATTDGFYYTDSFKVTRVSEEFPDTFATLVQLPIQRRRLMGIWEPAFDRVYWSVQENSSELTDSDKLFVLDTRWGVKRNGSFTTWSGIGDSFSPTSLLVFNKELLRADSRGYIFKHQSTLSTDPKVDTGKVPTDWVRNTIVWDYRSADVDFGTNLYRKWVPRINFQAKNASNLSLQIQSNNDDNKKVLSLAEIRFRGNLTWGDSNATWGLPETIWDYDGIIERQRYFPATGLRCGYKQVQFTNANTLVASSDALGLASVNFLAKTVVLETVTSSWPADSEDYTLSFEADNYVRQYLVTSTTVDTAIVNDPTSDLPDGAGIKWLLKGKPKEERFDLLAYTLHFAALSSTQQPFQGQTGGNA